MIFEFIKRSFLILLFIVASLFLLHGVAYGETTSITPSQTVSTEDRYKPAVTWYKDALDRVSLRRELNPQEVFIYNTDSGVNDEYALISWNLVGSRLDFGTWATGSGTQRNLYFQAGAIMSFNLNAGSEEWRIDSAGFFPATDNANTFGTDALRPATTYLRVLDLEPQAAAPGSPVSGMIYVDSTPTPDELCVYDGTGWQALITGTDANCA